MEVQRKHLVDELSWLAHFIEKKTTIPILSNVLFEADQKKLKLTATDLEIGAITSIDGAGKGAWSTTAPIAGLINYLKKVDEETVTLSVEGFWLNVVHGPGKSRTAGMSKESYPVLHAFPPATAWLFNLPQAISRTSFAISTEETRFTLNGALLEIDEDEAKMVATDGHRLALAPVKVKCAGKIRALLPKKLLTEAARLDGECSFAADNDFVFLDYGQRKITCRKLTGTFPDYPRLLGNGDIANHAVLPVKTTRKTLDRVSVYADERSRGVKLEIADGKMVIKASTTEGGECEGTVPLQSQEGCSPLNIGMNAVYMTDFLSRTDHQFVALGWQDDDLKVNDEGQPIKGRLAGEKMVQFTTGDQYIYCVMPLRA